MYFHIPVLLEETIRELKIKKGGIYYDLTFGGGGHTKNILEKQKDLKVVAFDFDVYTKNNLLKDPNLTYISSNFKYVKQYNDYLDQTEKVDGILADLGVSSYHFDNEQRGFSYNYPDNKIDMRMNKSQKKDAVLILNTYTENQLDYIFKEFGEIYFSTKLAKHIINYRQKNKIITVKDFLTSIENIVKKDNFKMLSKIFQAIRIETNNELESLEIMLENSISCLAKNGRLLIISYHSLEDRIVKNVFKKYSVKNEKKEQKFIVITNKPIVPNPNEIKKNIRSRSAKLRIIEKI